MKKTIKFILILPLILTAFFAFCNKVNADATECDKLTDLNTCKVRSDCGTIEVESGGKKVFSGCFSKGDAPACAKITTNSECEARTDCYLKKPGVLFIKAKCVDNPANAGLNTGVYGGTGKSQSSLSKAKFKCSDVKYLTAAWLIIRIVSPFLVILFGSLDFIKAVMANDEKEMKKSREKFIKRLIAFGLLIILTFAIQFIFETMGSYGSENMCLVKCITTHDYSSKGCE